MTRLRHSARTWVGRAVLAGLATSVTLSAMVLALLPRALS